ncbi:MAG: hypothetical protein K2L02_03405 [Clostridia bacterium]|nr:hypothetical protein [Clostridia bacterium]
MVKVIKQGVYYQSGKIEKESQAFMTSDKKENAVKNTLSYAILKAHGEKALIFDSLLSDVSSPDYNYGILSGVLSLGLDGFTVPYTLAAGGADVLSTRSSYESAKKFGGNFVPSGVASASYYLADCGAKKGELIMTSFGVSAGACGAMCVPGSDYDFLSQFLRMPYPLENKEVVGVFVKGKLRRGVGAIDVGLSFLKAFEEIDVSDKIFEFFGTGVTNLSMESRVLIDNIVRETGCFATVWETEDCAPVQPAFYDGGVTIDLTRTEPMISVADEIFTLEEFLSAEELPCDPDLLCRNENGEIYLNGGLVDGMLGGTFENIAEFAELLRGAKAEGDYRVYPVSRSVLKALAESGYLSLLSEEGVSVGEVALSNDLYDAATACAVAGRYAPLRLDVRTLAVSASLGGKLTSALEYKEIKRLKKYAVNEDTYSSVYLGAGKGEKEMKTECDYRYAFPLQEPLPKNLITRFSCVYGVDEGESDFSYPEADGEGRYFEASEKIKKTLGDFVPDENTRYSYAVASVFPDDICGEVCDEKMISVCIAKEAYSEEEIKALVNDGTIPFLTDKIAFKMDELLYFEGIAEAIKRKEERIVVKLISKRKTRDIVLNFAPLTEEQRKLLLAGGFIGYYKKKRK